MVGHSRLRKCAEAQQRFCIPSRNSVPTLQPQTPAREVVCIYTRFEDEKLVVAANSRHVLDSLRIVPLWKVLDLPAAHGMRWIKKQLTALAPRVQTR